MSHRTGLRVIRVRLLLTYVESTDIKDDDSDLSVDGLVLVVYQVTIIHLQGEERSQGTMPPQLLQARCQHSPHVCLWMPLQQRLPSPRSTYTFTRHLKVLIG